MRKSEPFGRVDLDGQANPIGDGRTVNRVGAAAIASLSSGQVFHSTELWYREGVSIETTSFHIPVRTYWKTLYLPRPTLPCGSGLGAQRREGLIDAVTVNSLGDEFHFGSCISNGRHGQTNLWSSAMRWVWKDPEDLGDDDGMMT